MKFAFKILGYVTMIAINFLIYVFVFFILIGMEPHHGMAYARYKIDQIISDSVFVAEQEIVISKEMQKEIDKTKAIVAAELEDLKKQRAQWFKDKTELEAMRDNIQRMVKKKSKEEEDRMYKLAKIYDGMDQQSVAEVFAQMDDSLIVAILPKMKPANAGLVLEFLPAQRSAKLSRMLLKEM